MSTAPSGWTELGAAQELFYAEADGSFALLRSGNEMLALTLTAAVPSLTAMQPRRLVTTLGGQSVEFRLFDTPSGPVLDYQSGAVANGLAAVMSPDRRRLAVARVRESIWVVDVATGAVRRVTSDPEPRPPNLVKHMDWQWVSIPRWSADGRWIRFLTNRADPARFVDMQVSADGGPEQPAPVDAPDPFLGAELGSSFRSPEGRWRVDTGTAGILQVFDRQNPSTPRIVPLPPGSLVDGGIERFSPDGERVLIHFRVNPYEIAGLLGLLDLRSGDLSVITFPDPLGGHPTPLGWIGADRALVGVTPWDKNYVFPADRSGMRVWLLDLPHYRAAAPVAPGRIVYARLALGHAFDPQAGGVLQGEAIITDSPILSIRFDRPLLTDWLREHVLVSGDGSHLETHGAPVGLVTVQIGDGQGDVQVRVPDFNYDLILHRVPPLAATFAIRQGAGAWQAAAWGSTRPAAPTDLQVRFNRPVAAERAVKALRAALDGAHPSIAGAGVEWAEGVVLIRLPTPPPVLRASPARWVDVDGSEVTVQLPTLWFGDPPVLVAAGPADRTLLTLPQEVIRAEVNTTGRQVTLERWPSGGYRQVTTVFDLASGQNQETPLELVAEVSKGLVRTRRLGNRMAGLLPERWLGRSGGYRWEGSLVVRDLSGQELQHFPGLQSYWPLGENWSRFAGDLAWSPDGTRVALTLATGATDHTLVVADLATGRLRTVAALAETGFHSLVWSPGGRYIAAGRAVVDVAAGGVVRKLAAAEHLRWASDETQVLYNLQTWGKVQVANVTTGAVRSLGAGMPVGWDAFDNPLVIRWQHSQHRYVPAMP